MIRLITILVVGGAAMLIWGGPGGEDGHEMAGVEKTAGEMPGAQDRSGEMTEKATFGAGCFWHVEYGFAQVAGVVGTKVGYMGGHTERPSYQEVCSGRTGHAEVCQVEYDPAKVSYEHLLEAFWRMHDATQVNRQGPDVGSQYRSVIFVHNEEQRAAAEASRGRWQEKIRRQVATEIADAGEFWGAEEYHQEYFKKHGKTCGI